MTNHQGQGMLGQGMHGGMQGQGMQVCDNGLPEVVTAIVHS